MPKLLSPAQVEAFDREGFVAPVRAISAERALYYRRKLEAFENTYPNDRLKLDQKAHMICPWVDDMIREPGILDATQDLIGPDILCWGTSLRAKQPDGKTFAGWHQDTAYADVKPIVVIVALALSPAGVENGCVRGIPGSHRGPLLLHKEAFATDSLLSREQFIDATFDETRAVDYWRLLRVRSPCSTTPSMLIEAECRQRPAYSVSARDGAHGGLPARSPRICHPGARQGHLQQFRS